MRPLQPLGSVQRGQRHHILLVAAFFGATVRADLYFIASIIPLMIGQSRNLGDLQLGDDTAAGLGVALTRSRLLLIVAAVALLAFATAATGPIAFVAFMAGPIARALDRGRPTIVGAALVGAVVVVAADLIGGHVIPDVHLPAGVVTGVTGAPVLLWLMTRGRTEGTL